MYKIIIYVTFLILGLVGFFVAIHIFAQRSSFDNKPDNNQNFTTAVKQLAVPFSDINDLGKIIKKAQYSKYVLLGESSHGTKEYYSIRAEISKELIQNKGFNFVAVEGNWVQLYEANKYAKGLPNSKENAYQALASVSQWPEWMWINGEFVDFVEWLADYNKNLTENDRVGIYGMDLQGLWDSLDKTIELLQKTDPQLSLIAADNYSCFDDFSKDQIEYMKFTRQGENCQKQTEEVVDQIKLRFGSDDLANDTFLFKLKQNALAVKYGEAYYRIHAVSGETSWNERARYMKQTVERLSDFYQNGSKGIIWAHNTHVGDARATDMANKGLINIGQLLRQDHKPGDIFILGFSTYKGSVIAGNEWGQQRQVVQIPKAIAGSAEDLLNNVGLEKYFIIFDEHDLSDILHQPLGHRAKGVVYNPEKEHLGNYVSTVLPKRYDALVFIRETSALTLD